MSDTSNPTGQEDFLAAYDEYSDAIFRFCLVKVSDREKALDITQETFTRAWDYQRKGSIIESWKPFLFRTAYNLIVDSYRKKKSSSLDAMEEDINFIPPDTATLTTEMKAEFSRVIKALDSLDDGFKEPITLRFVEGLSPSEIGAIMGVSENVISVRIHRGLEKLKVLLHAHDV